MRAKDKGVRGAGRQSGKEGKQQTGFKRIITLETVVVVEVFVVSKARDGLV